MVKNPKFITYASVHRNGDPTTFYVCDLNSLSIVELLEIMGKNYMKTIMKQYPLFTRFRLKNTKIEIVVGLN